jgi:hypothetical protein
VTSERELVLRSSAEERARLLVGGYSVDRDALAGGSYRGTSLGLPSWLEAATWTTFRKVFAPRQGGRVVGWNVRVEQSPPYRARRRHGAEWVFGHYEVVDLDAGQCPLAVHEGVLLDYGRGRNPALDPTRLVRDPLVALRQGSVDLLLGYTYLRVLGRSIPTPSWFLLEREA